MTGNTITKINESTYETVYRGCTYTLIEDSHGWSMWNKPTGGRVGIPKAFDTLPDVEAAYKHWAGISQLVATEIN
jgi:hypothetical protein